VAPSPSYRCLFQLHPEPVQLFTKAAHSTGGLTEANHHLSIATANELSLFLGIENIFSTEKPTGAAGHVELSPESETGSCSSDEVEEFL
jgi:hypothetical protein